VRRLAARHRTAAAAAAVLVAIAFLGVAGPALLPWGTGEQVGAPYTAPSPAHPLGLDDGGVDVLELVLAGARVSLLVGLAAAVISGLVGGLVGILAGYFGGWADAILMRITDYFIVVPVVPLMIVAAALWGASLLNVILIIGLLLWTTTARVVRAQVKSVRQRAYVRRVEGMGAGHGRILVRHVLPQVAPLLVANTVLTVALAIFAETALAFLGLSDPDVTSWGTLIDNAFRRGAISQGAWWAILPPGVCVAVVVLALSVIGRTLEDALNPRLRVSHLSGAGFGRLGRAA